jgi:hypothetical protein
MATRTAAPYLVKQRNGFRGVQNCDKLACHVQGEPTGHQRQLAVQKANGVLLDRQPGTYPRQWARHQRCFTFAQFRLREDGEYPQGSCSDRDRDGSAHHPRKLSKTRGCNTSQHFVHQTAHGCKHIHALLACCRRADTSAGSSSRSSILPGLLLLFAEPGRRNSSLK